MNPLLRASLTSGILYSIGDIMTQTFSLAQLDVNRTIKFALTGSLLHGPYFLYGFRMLDTKFPGSSLKSSITKAMLGQIFLFPPFVTLLLTFTAFLDGKSASQSLKEKWITINTSGLLVWPAANIINFKFVPVQYRVLYVNMIGLGWNTYLSAVAH